MTHYLKFPDETTGMAALNAAGLIYTDDDGTFDIETGEMITPPIPRPGWHVNYIGTLPDGWDAYVVEPLRPSRVFA